VLQVLPVQPPWQRAKQKEDTAFQARSSRTLPLEVVIDEQAQRLALTRRSTIAFHGA